ncbi:hypothetical protein ADUPG1_011352, partial [Aduncisulcus paluster]
MFASAKKKAIEELTEKTKAQQRAHRLLADDTLRDLDSFDAKLGDMTKTSSESLRNKLFKSDSECRILGLRPPRDLSTWSDPTEFYDFSTPRSRSRGSVSRSSSGSGHRIKRLSQPVRISTAAKRRSLSRVLPARSALSQLDAIFSRLQDEPLISAEFDPSMQSTTITTQSHIKPRRSRSKLTPTEVFVAHDRINRALMGNKNYPVRSSSAKPHLLSMTYSPGAQRQSFPHDEIPGQDFHQDTRSSSSVSNPRLSPSLIVHECVSGSKTERILRYVSEIDAATSGVQSIVNSAHFVDGTEPDRMHIEGLDDMS